MNEILEIFKYVYLIRVPMGLFFKTREEKEEWWQVQLKNEVDKLDILRAELTEILGRLMNDAGMIDMPLGNLKRKIELTRGTEQKKAELAFLGARKKVDLESQELVVKDILRNMESKGIVPKHTAKVPKPKIAA